MANDRDLAPLLLQRGARFVESGRWARARGFSDELVLSQLCWGLELALKGYLLARGCSDEHNRRAHRHDLIKASHAAQQLGLTLGRSMEWLLADVAPYARRHAIPEALARRPDLLARHDAVSLAEGLVCRVRRALRVGGSPDTPLPHPPLLRRLRRRAGREESA
ncbi:hypothetical protein LRS10_23410 [Phenylobacterium sp. J426]|uniref:hypothetical protein n=1 Tax=Phenylobacterium sp. J426 TaxID=2898439 RepID=UPI0021510AF7|nr:hypothetical protein [Phenylobacterium sp. J426]MCR5876840.1 hypothetical protein [Phenylobacterium sp. J426]